MCDPILVTLLKMRPYYSQFSLENATPSSGTSPLASYKEVPPPPPNPGSLTGSFHCMSKWTSFLPDSLEIIPFKLLAFFPLFDRIPRDSTLSLAVFKKSRSEIIVAKKRRCGIENLTNCFTTQLDKWNEEISCIVFTESSVELVSRIRICCIKISWPHKVVGPCYRVRMHSKRMYKLGWILAEWKDEQKS